MTETSISLASILSGVLGANILGYFFPKYSFGITGNSIAGVFGGVFFIKMIGRLGINPTSIVHSVDAYYWLLFLNLLISFLGGFTAIVIAKTLKNKADKR